MNGEAFTPEHSYSEEYLKEFLAMDYAGLQFFGIILCLVGVIIFGYSLTKHKDMRMYGLLVFGTGVFFCFFEEILRRVCGL